MNYAVSPIPLNLVLSWIAGGLVEMTLAGALLGLVAGKQKPQADGA